MISDIITYLTAKGRGGKLFNSFEDVQGSFAGVRSVLTPYGGMAPMEVQEDADSRIDVWTFQIMTQGLDPGATEQEAHRTQNELARVRNQTLGSTFYLKITPLQPPFFLTWSEPVVGVRQITYAHNYQVWKRPAYVS